MRLSQTSALLTAVLCGAVWQSAGCKSAEKKEAQNTLKRLDEVGRLCKKVEQLQEQAVEEHGYLKKRDPKTMPPLWKKVHKVRLELKGAKNVMVSESPLLRGAVKKHFQWPDHPAKWRKMVYTVNYCEPSLRAAIKKALRKAIKK